MDLLTAAKVMTRHWLLTPTALLLAVAAVGVVYLKVPTTYSGNALVLLQGPLTGGASLPPVSKGPQVSPATVHNPYLSIDGSLFVLGQVISSDLTSDQTKALLERDGQTVNYQVTVRSEEPAIGIVVTDHDRAKIVARLNDLITAATTDLALRQAAVGLPKETWVTANVSNVPLNMTKTKDKLKMLIAVAAVAFGVAISLVFGVESFQAGYRRRERSRLLETLHELEKQRGLETVEQPVEVPQYG